MKGEGVFELVNRPDGGFALSVLCELLRKQESGAYGYDGILKKETEC